MRLAMFGFAFFDKMKNIYNSNASVTGFDQVITDEYTGADDSQRVVPYTTNHDVNTSTLIDWSLNPNHVEEYKKIMAFYKSSTALQKGTFISHHSPDVCDFGKEGLLFPTSDHLCKSLISTFYHLNGTVRVIFKLDYLQASQPGSAPGWYTVVVEEVPFSLEFTDGMMGGPAHHRC